VGVHCKNTRVGFFPTLITSVAIQDNYILYSRSIWVEAMPNVNNCFSSVNIQVAYFSIVYHSANTHALNAFKDTSLEERPASQFISKCFEAAP